MEKINVLFESSPDYSNNAKALFEYMNDHYKDKINLYWVFNDNEIYLKYKDKLNCVLYNSKDFKKLFPKINIIFTTHGQLIEEKLSNQIYVNLWHGIGPKKAGNTLDDLKLAPQDKKFFLDMRRKTDYMICPTYFWQYIFTTVFKYNASRVLPIAYPKLDEIIYSNGKNNLKNILNIDLKEYNKIILYTPTFKKGLGRKDENANTKNLFDFEEYDEKQVLDYLEKNNYLLLIKYHPSEETKFQKINHSNVKYITEKMLKKYDLNINNILNASDILITDYSSLGVEYTILDKPVIYLDNNIEQYKKGRGIMFETGDFWMENKASNVNELLVTISNCKKKEISRHKKIFFENLKDGGCENIINYFFTKSFKLRKNIVPYRDEYDELLDDYNKLLKKSLKNDLVIKDLKIKLDLVYNSKSWKILEKLRKIKRKIRK